ncbi:MAG: hypothetical protein HN590_07465 [Calditrichaeota bacterium]|nr:hypothetical protein [Calditrichota bacterium]
MNTNRKTAKSEDTFLSLSMLAGLILLGLFFLNTTSIAQESVRVHVSGEPSQAFRVSGNETGSVSAAAKNLNKPTVSALQLQDDKMRSKLSTLWTAVTLNMITADVLTLYIPESMEEWDDYADGKESEFMLGGAIMYQVPISMVFLSKILPHKVSRWTNIIAAGVMSGAVLAGGESEPHYWVFASAEVIGMSLIAWNAWKWENPDGDNRIKNVNMRINVNKETYGLACSFNF